MNKKLSLIFIIILVSISLYGCRENDGPLDNVDDGRIEVLEQRISELEAENFSLSEELSILREGQGAADLEENLIRDALEVVNLIKDQDFDALQEWVNPEVGLLFSPYAYVDYAVDVILLEKDLPNIMESDEVFIWGAFDGTGYPIEFTFREFYERFIYDEDYVNAHIIGNNVEVSTGSMINNIEEAFPGAEFVEFHFTGFEEQFIGMDWRSLRLVFQEDNDRRYLVGIVHDEWTI
ncbi:hypothetical protein EDC18_108106 [Natranaerovirga pectinivora]|uniref:Uncharacterized protein n=1 Tax=Natranaerovirga pectinivora TaxID=682400 RepID=A0A4R3MIC3_9FIRM|nr:hypothetical protein [Natranaerovirga pectinivora]TCT13868.1 hypothetical protein EDC18_108106 [Natranaerovirga pectinivora]